MDEETSYGEITHRVLNTWNAGNLVRAALDAQSRRATIPIDRIHSDDKFQIPATQAVRVDGPDAGQGFGWTYDLGSFRDPAKPIIVTAGALPSYDINVNGPRVDVPEPRLQIKAFKNVTDRRRPGR